MTETSEPTGKRGSIPPGRGASAPPSGPTPASLRRSKRLVVIVFLAFVIGWVGLATGQIIQQALFPAVSRSPYPTCGAGLRALSRAIDEGRVAAHSEEDPDRGLRAFRTSIGPIWADLEGVRATCHSEGELRGLDAVERLRYAEEQAVRREAASLALTRQQADRALAELDPPGASPLPASPASSASSSTRDPGSLRERDTPPAPNSPPP